MSFVSTTIINIHRYLVCLFGTAGRDKKLQTLMSQHATVSVGPFPTAAVYSHQKKNECSFFFLHLHKDGRMTDKSLFSPSSLFPSISVGFVPLSLSVTLYCIVFLFEFKTVCRIVVYGGIIFSSAVVKMFAAKITLKFYSKFDNLSMIRFYHRTNTIILVFLHVLLY